MRGLRRLGALTTTLVLASALVGCGGGSDSAATTTTTTTTAADGGTDGSGTGSGTFSSECITFVSAYAGAIGALSSIFAGGKTEDIEKAAAYFESVKDKLPSDIRADFDLFTEAYGKLAKGLADANVDFSDPTSIDPTKLEKLQALSEALNDQKVQTARDNIDAFVSAHCEG